MSVTATGGAAPVREQKVPEQEEGSRSYERRSDNPSEPGGKRPDDFGHSNPDNNGDGTISDNELSAYKADQASEDRRYEADSRASIAHEKEVGKDYRADKAAATAQNASNNDNKMHKMFGKQAAPVKEPERPASLS